MVGARLWMPKFLRHKNYHQYTHDFDENLPARWSGGVLPKRGWSVTVVTVTVQGQILRVVLPVPFNKMG